ncbi:hypothetical protein EV363DRAFT_1169254 [Boletus edulis]|nr:hypothetical protein EV363DRAFT_1169269 [Boletus edulis]KAF8129211.1 hypothetical protein EV363DRAFT_1169254 [Boletus edulis]
MNAILVASVSVLRRGTVRSDIFYLSILALLCHYDLQLGHRSLFHHIAPMPTHPSLECRPTGTSNRMRASNTLLKLRSDGNYPHM